MLYKFVSMDKDYAREMIENWKYGGDYSVYDYANEAQELLDEKSWGYSKFAALDDKGALSGELTIELFRDVDETSEEDGYIDYETYKSNLYDDYEMWIGFGLRPDITGKGYGREFVSSCIDFAVRIFDYKGDFIRLAVYDFNQRAVRTYLKLGFEVFNTIEIAQENKTVLQMRKL